MYMATASREQDARESFEICLTEFFDYSIKKKTLVAELESLGWTIKKQKKFTAPAFSSLLEKNKVLKKDHGYERVQED